MPLIVLSVLRREPMHGYALLVELERDYGQMLRLGAGTLYPLLKRLERRGLLESHEADESSGRSRRIYSITAAGVAYFKENRLQIRALAGVLRQALGKKWLRG
ncbi:helix-turn-helix transcriptional regulator [Candidatus Sumerlaeota bacterium]|nr:helix-turn-helix transcriptional regulator [Candidatus Sumerlaeota bacterium]